MLGRPYLYGYPQSARFGDQRDNCSGPSRYLRICPHPTLPNANGASGPEAAYRLAPGGNGFARRIRHRRNCHNAKSRTPSWTEAAPNASRSAPIRPRTTIKAAHIEIATTRRTLSLPLGLRPPRRRYRQSANAPKMARIKRIPGKGLAGRSSGETKTSNTRHLRRQLHLDRDTFYTTDEETACASATSFSLPVLTS